MWSASSSAADGAFAAGLIAGDGFFVIRPNNAGSSWTCGLAVSLRADDTPLLAALCRWFGAGRLAPVAARRNSRPQTVWLIQRQADCHRAVSILQPNLVLGKKAGEFAIWRRAVRAWTSDHRDRNRIIAACAEELIGHRRPEHVPSLEGVDITGEHLLAFFAGFATAEGHFGASQNGHPGFLINVRDDDRALLHLFCDRFGIGHLVGVPPRGTSRAALSWRVSRRVELRQLVGLLDRHPPRGRVARIYQAWRVLVLLEKGTAERRELAAEIRRRRAYKPGLGEIVSDPLEVRRTRHLAALRSWAASAGGPYTVTRYAAWRGASEPRAPNRNTIVAAFGTWSAAVTAAGLSTAGCRAAAVIERTRTAAAAARAEHRRRQRAAILEAVRVCTDALGRVPRSTDFFAWRNRCAPELPSQMTVYRHFPGGWQAVLDALGKVSGAGPTDEQLQAT